MSGVCVTVLPQMQNDPFKIGCLGLVIPVWELFNCFPMLLKGVLLLGQGSLGTAAAAVNARNQVCAQFIVVHCHCRICSIFKKQN